MDGLPPPPIPHAPPVQPASSTTTAAPPPPPGSFQAGYQGGQLSSPPSQSSGNPVGRPSSDPERQAERAEQSASVSRMMRSLPKAATDPRIGIYKLQGRRGRHAEARSRLNILVSDIEEASEHDIPPEDYIEERIREELPPGRYLCVPQDQHGHRIKKASQWEISTVQSDSDYDDDDDPRGRRYDDDEEEMAIPGMPNNPMGQMPLQGFGAPPPPPSLYPDPQSIESIRDVLSTQQRKEENSNNLMLMVMQQQQQMDARLREERERRETERREEERRWREEEQRREERRLERERADRNDRLQLVASIAPIFVPLLQKLMDGKEDKITPILLTKLMETQENKSSAHEMIALMSEASKQQVLLQGEMSRQNMQQQSEANSMMMQHVLKMAQDTISAQRVLEDGEDSDPLTKFGKVISTIAPMLQGAQAYQRPTVANQGFQHQAVPQIPQQPAQAPASAPPANRATIKPPQRGGQPSREDHPDLPDDQWVYGALDTIRRIEAGEIAPEKRPEALAWCATNLPQDLQQAVLQENEQLILERCGGVVAADQRLLAWMTDGQFGEIHQQFLRGCINDIRLILSNQISEERLQEMVSEQAEYRRQMDSIHGKQQELDESSEPTEVHKPPPPPIDEGVDDQEERMEDDPYGESPDSQRLLTPSEEGEEGEPADSEAGDTPEDDAAQDEV